MRINGVEMCVSKTVALFMAVECDIANARAWDVLRFHLTTHDLLTVTVAGMMVTAEDCLHLSQRHA